MARLFYQTQEQYNYLLSLDLDETQQSIQDIDAQIAAIEKAMDDDVAIKFHGREDTIKEGQEEEYKELEKQKEQLAEQKAKLQNDYRNAKNVQALYFYSSMKDLEYFEDYALFGSLMEGDDLHKAINYDPNADAAMTYKGLFGVGFLTEEEVKIYNCCKFLSENFPEYEGLEKQFIADMSDILRQREGKWQAEAAQSAGIFGEIAHSISSGAQRTVNSIGQLFNEGQLDPTAYDYATGLLLSDMTDIEKFLYQGGYTFGSASIPLIAGILNPGLGAATATGASAGDAYRQALFNGYSEEDAMNMAFGSGLKTLGKYAIGQLLFNIGSPGYGLGSQTGGVGSGLALNSAETGLVAGGANLPAVMTSLPVMPALPFGMNSILSSVHAEGLSPANVQIFQENPLLRAAFEKVQMEDYLAGAARNLSPAIQGMLQNNPLLRAAYEKVYMEDYFAQVDAEARKQQELAALEEEDGAIQDVDGAEDGRYNEGEGISEDAGKVITEIKYKPSSGVALKATPGKTTTILGSYEKDMKSIVGELGNVKSTDFGSNVGGLNILNVPDDMYKNADQFGVRLINLGWIK